ncbi:MAG: hypothetical protein MUF18_12450 [Fimbriiglobus sp.]|nr:hypothetical protein [Fimbriiglobus sp.]
MCCFSKTAEVSDTNIFARAGKDGRQFLVYSMTVKAAEELAMILPIPTPKASKEDAVQFLALDKYEGFFDEMRKGWPVNRGKGPPPMLGGLGSAPAPLQVVEVGSFIASFVPTQKDFDRVDDKFKLPADVWAKLPQYKDWGFAVFQLKKGEKKVHPMAFDFPRADPKKLFFPTVHIHDGKVEEKAGFDHTLYCQASAGENIIDWEETPQPAGLFMTKLDKAHGIVDDKDHVYRKTMKGKLKNADVWMG